MSSATFQVPSMSNSPHWASTPSIRCGLRSARSTAIPPPIDMPLAIVRRGWPTLSSNQSSSRIWSVSAGSTVRPVTPRKFDAANA